MKILQTIVVLAALAGTAQFAAGQLPAERAEEQQQRDARRIVVQEICPVTGEKLGSMGDPVKAQIGEEILFLCCKGCLKGKIDPQHWATIHANFAKAQGICPVMKHDLPKKPKWTIVEGQIIYVCCPPCLEKVAAEPELYLQAVDNLYAAALEERKTTR